MSEIAAPAERVIDVTAIDPAHRHTILFQLIEHLPAGHALQLVVDHDPRRLRLQIEDRYGVTIDVLPDGEAEGARMSVEASGPPPEHAPRFAPVVIEDEDDDD